MAEDKVALKFPEFLPLDGHALEGAESCGDPVHDHSLADRTFHPVA
jgi:hypothetical protein